MSHGTAMARSRIAAGGSKVEERHRIKEDFTRARGLYLQVTGNIVKMHDAIAEAKSNVKHCQDNQRGIEAGWTPSGKNADERRICFDNWRAADDEWQKLADAIRINETFIAKEEAVLRDEEYQVRLARYDMAMAIAEMNAIAGEVEHDDPHRH